jgi:hypothetical protein
MSAQGRIPWQQVLRRGKGRDSIDQKDGAHQISLLLGILVEAAERILEASS